MTPRTHQKEVLTMAKCEMKRFWKYVPTKREHGEIFYSQVVYLGRNGAITSNGQVQRRYAGSYSTSCCLGQTRALYLVQIEGILFERGTFPFDRWLVLPFSGLVEWAHVLFSPNRVDQQNPWCSSPSPWQWVG